MSTEDILNFKRINENITTGGQPTEEQLQAVATEGVQTVINLAPTGTRSSLKDEAGLVQFLGMNYHHIPVDWNDPKRSDFEAFEQVMDTAVSQKTLIHCAANYRVTAFYSLYAQKHLGWSEEQADKLMAHVWQSGQFPIWDQFVEEMREGFVGSEK